MNRESKNEDPKHRLRVEAGLAQRFFKAFERKTDQLELRRDFRLNEKEQKVLYDLATSNVLEGTAAGILTFLLLRRLRAAYYKRMQGSVSKPTLPNAFNSPFQQQNPPVQKIPTVMEGVQDQSRFRFSRMLFNSFTIFIDGVLSFYVTLYVSTRNNEVFLRKVTELPLLEGRSTVADELCPVFLEELKSIYQDQQNQRLSSVEVMALEDPESPSLKTILNFCTNCQRRAAYEELLRREQGLSPDEPVAIPAPGVPVDVPFTDLSMLADITGVWESESQEKEKEFFNAPPSEDTMDPMEPTDWTEDFVRDLEDEDPRRKRPS